jgi:DNA adenine methylase
VAVRLNSSALRFVVSAKSKSLSAKRSNGGRSETGPAHQKAFRKSFLKWPGGKRKLLPRIMSALDGAGAIDRFVEPFAGSGVVFLNVDARAYLVADKNPDVVATFEMLKNDTETFIERTRALFVAENNTKAAYLALRARFNASQSGAERASLFVYLNRHGFNGLCRYNRAEEFNVPFGKPKAPYFPEAEMHVFAERAKHATFMCGDFRDVLAFCQRGDVVYADPPYLPLSQTAGFTAYAAGGFSEEDQAALASLARNLASRGIPVVVSNRDVGKARQLYRGARMESFEVRYTIGATASARGPTPELLARFTPAPLPSPASPKMVWRKRKDDDGLRNVRFASRAAAPSRARGTSVGTVRRRFENEDASSLAPSGKLLLAGSRALNKRGHAFGVLPTGAL